MKYARVDFSRAKYYSVFNMRLFPKRTRSITKPLIIVLVLVALVLFLKWSDLIATSSSVLIDRICARRVLDATLQNVPAAIPLHSPSDRRGARAAQEPFYSSQLQDNGRVDKLKGTITIVQTRETPERSMSFALSIGNWGSVNYELSKEDIKHLRAVRLVEENEFPADVSELKPGDTVLVEVKTDYTRQVGSNQEFKITKM